MCIRYKRVLCKCAYCIDILETFKHLNHFIRFRAFLCISTQTIWLINATLMQDSVFYLHLFAFNVKDFKDLKMILVLHGIVL